MNETNPTPPPASADSGWSLDAAAATARASLSLLKAHRQRVLTAEPPALVHRHLAEAFDAFGSVQRAAA